MFSLRWLSVFTGLLLFFLVIQRSYGGLPDFTGDPDEFTAVTEEMMRDNWQQFGGDFGVPYPDEAEASRLLDKIPRYSREFTETLQSHSMTLHEFGFAHNGGETNSAFLSRVLIKAYILLLNGKFDAASRLATTMGVFGLPVTVRAYAISSFLPVDDARDVETAEAQRIRWVQTCAAMVNHTVMEELKAVPYLYFMANYARAKDMDLRKKQMSLTDKSQAFNGVYEACDEQCQASKHERDLEVPLALRVMKAGLQAGYLGSFRAQPGSKGLGRLVGGLKRGFQAVGSSLGATYDFKEGEIMAEFSELDSRAALPLSLNYVKADAYRKLGRTVEASSAFATFEDSQPLSAEECVYRRIAQKRIELKDRGGMTMERAALLPLVWNKAR